MPTPHDFVKVRPVELDDAQAICDAIVESEVELGRWWLPGVVDRATPDDERERIAARIQARVERTAFAFVVLDVRGVTSAK